jgi:hypothetical protein
MAVERMLKNADDFIGKSTDTKPTPKTVGCTFYETDTKKIYIWDGTDWTEV